MAWTVGTTAGSGFDANDTLSGSPLTLTRPTDVVEGDLMIVAVGTDRVSNASVTCTDIPAGWTYIGSYNAGATHPYLGLWRKEAGASEPDTYTFSLNAHEGGIGGIGGGIVRITGHKSSAPIETFEMGDLGGTSDEWRTQEVTSSATDALILTFSSFGDARNISAEDSNPPSTFTMVFLRAMGSASSNNPSMGAAYKEKATPGTESTAISTPFTTLRNQTKGTIVLNPATGGGGGIAITTFGGDNIVSSHETGVVLVGTGLSASSSVALQGVTCTVTSVSGSTYAELTLPNFLDNDIRPGARTAWVDGTATHSISAHLAGMWKWTTLSSPAISATGNITYGLSPAAADNDLVVFSRFPLRNGSTLSYTTTVSTNGHVNINAGGDSDSLSMKFLLWDVTTSDYGSTAIYSVNAQAASASASGFGLTTVKLGGVSLTNVSQFQITMRGT